MQTTLPGRLQTDGWWLVEPPGRDIFSPPREAPPYRRPPSREAEVLPFRLRPAGPRRQAVILPFPPQGDARSGPRPASASHPTATPLPQPEDDPA